MNKDEEIKQLKAIIKEQNEQLRLHSVSVSLLRKKAKEYAKFIYAEGYNDPIYHPEVMQTMSDFEAGFKAGMRFYNER